jgi:hypothetical protein
VLPFGKTTFVDKTFAPDVATAERIFKKADQHKAALQSSSALRYTAVQKVVQELGRDRCGTSWRGVREAATTSTRFTRWSWRSPASAPTPSP